MTRFGSQILTRRVARAAGARLRNEVAAGGFAERAGGNGLVPNAGIAVFFATGPENLYQFEQWRRPLERLAERQPVFMITDRADTGDALLASTSLPLAFARGVASVLDVMTYFGALVNAGSGAFTYRQIANRLTYVVGLILGDGR